MRDREDIKPQTPEAGKIQCSTCIYRDKSTLRLTSGKIIAIGITRNACAAFPEHTYPYGKPYNVLFNNMPCEYYKGEG